MYMTIVLLSGDLAAVMRWACGSGVRRVGEGASRLMDHLFWFIFVLARLRARATWLVASMKERVFQISKILVWIQTQINSALLSAMSDARTDAVHSSDDALPLAPAHACLCAVC